APILALPEGSEDFIVYCDASNKGLGVVLMQREKVISYASRQLKIHEEKLHDSRLGTWSSSVRSKDLEALSEPMEWQTDYGIMEKGMSILRGRKFVPGINSCERGNGKKRTTLSS
nr:putative reverse transcriptase domain-containing protein [Tanacetum cinerariifolium]